MGGLGVHLNSQIIIKFRSIGFFVRLNIAPSKNIIIFFDLQ